MDSQMLARSDDGRPTVHFDELHPTFKGGYRVILGLQGLYFGL